MSSPAPAFVALTPEECVAFLEAHHVGRVAYFFRQVVDIEPIHYVFADNWIFGRTSKGAKLDMLRHQPWVAFEVDEVRGEFEWQSVVARGDFKQIANEGTSSHRELFARAVEAIQRRSPAAFTPDDPTPHRTIVFGISIHELHGRKATTA